MITRALRLAVLPKRSHARSRMTRLERGDDDAAVAADEVRWSTSGVPVKAVAIAMTSARSRAVMAALMVGKFCVDAVVVTF